MKKIQIVRRALIGMVCLGSTIGAAYSLQKLPTPYPRETQSIETSATHRSEVKTLAPDRWKQVDDFKNDLPGLLRDSRVDPQRFVITELAGQLSNFRVGGFPVCADEEISAEQYIQLSDVAKKLDLYSNATSQMNKLLDTPAGITDCQFRVLQGATASDRSASNP